MYDAPSVMPTGVVVDIASESLLTAKALTGRAAGCMAPDAASALQGLQESCDWAFETRLEGCLSEIA